MKIEKEERICAYCEHAKIKASEEYEEEIFICSKRKKEMPPNATCRNFAYDLLKKKVQPRPTLPSLEEMEL